MEGTDNTSLFKPESKKARNRTGVILLCISVTFVILIVSTYAWFIGTTEVMVNEFEVEVMSSDGLTISLDAVTFSESVNISQTGITTTLASTYATHKNHWVGQDGLEPVSTVGTYDTTNNALTLFSKASITSQQGGYKLRTTRIENYNPTTHAIDEKDSYIAFDIFIKNTSGEGYSATYAPEDAEGIYLSPNSGVTLTTAGSGGDGIENSVRVGMFSVGRVDMNASAAAAQAINCSATTFAAQGADPAYTLTPVCGRGVTVTPQGGGNAVESNGMGITWNIYEPNDTAHTANSISHFTRVCKQKSVSGGVVTFGSACTPLVDGTATTTYAANAVITAADEVNIYDGLNNFSPVSNKLTAMDYYTDTEKNASAANKTEIFFLAPNSITKMRIYVYLEGQDVDNYDLGQIGKKVVVTFGFTKDKFAEATPAVTP